MASQTEAKKDVKEGNETVTHAESGLGSNDPNTGELRAGLATGSNAANPNQPDGDVIQKTTEPLHPDKDTTADLSVVTTAEGKKGPAA